MTVAEQATTQLIRMGISSLYAVTVYIITQMKKRKKMTKDEMKNRISMALKDPILQQGFEIICKENAELNKKLSEAEADYDKMFWNKNEIISKAKEIIKMLHSDCYSIAECEDTNLGPWEDDLAKAEQFLKEVS